ncbi:hypothetical protein AVEN_50583-1 [Araneus ventricosus]|uniref:Uncharacterized protein n=1 Tax=Araneus ventricosus TaxID=182803 RepID=A0A4Y2AR84_ARAVE|nr:hypothetical protein AVEN_50583-1 [Araneus ventricosus]
MTESRKNGMIVGAHFAGVTVTETSTVLRYTGNTVTPILTLYTTDDKMMSWKHNSGRKTKMTGSKNDVKSTVISNATNQLLALFSEK